MVDGDSRRSEQESFFRRNAPPSLLRAMLRVIFDGCIAAYNETRAGVASGFFKDAIPTARRVKVEAGLSGLVRLPPGFTISLFPTTTTNYTEIRSPQIVITAVSRSRRVQSVGRARYREMLARPAQLSLLEPDRPFDPANGVYGLLVYGGPLRQRVPSVAMIAFPTADGNFLPSRISLIQEFPEIVQSYTVRESSGFGRGSAEEGEQG